MNGYYYLSENQILSLIYQARSSKDPVVKEAVNQLNYQLNKAKAENTNYRTAAQNKLSKLDAKAFNNDELAVDDDALVSATANGAHVQCWVWVENDIKPRRTRKRTVK
jgi:vacuolar-type H+-ATPase subunit H